MSQRIDLQRQIIGRPVVRAPRRLIKSKHTRSAPPWTGITSRRMTLEPGNFGDHQLKTHRLSSLFFFIVSICWKDLCGGIFLLFTLGTRYVWIYGPLDIYPFRPCCCCSIKDLRGDIYVCFRSQPEALVHNASREEKREIQGVNKKKREKGRALLNQT